jgi:hypothetical protein
VHDLSAHDAAEYSSLSNDVSLNLSFSVESAKQLGDRLRGPDADRIKVITLSARIL